MAIPDSNSGWGLQDVINEVSPISNDLIACFAAARSDFFNSDYYGTENDMLEFRDYGSHNSGLTNLIISVSPSSYSVGAGVNTEYSTVTTGPDSGTWSIKSSPTWVTATKESTTQLKMVIASNSGSARVGYVVVRHDDDIDIIASVKITQEQGT